MAVQRAGGADPMNARAVVALLAPTVGWERSEEAVAASVRRLGLDAGRLSPDQVRQLLEDLAMEQGMVGVTARVVLTRKNPSRGDIPVVTMSPPPSVSTYPPPDDSAPASVRLVGTIGLHEVKAQLGPLLGADKTDAAIDAAVRRQGLPRERLDREQTVRLLDDLGHQDGVVGMAARFVRPRVLALFGG
jgi:hypothetical protein